MSFRLFFPVKALAALVLGLAAGYVFLNTVTKLPLQFDSSVYQFLGIHKPQTVGFLPFWLLTNTDKPYHRYIRTITYFGLTLNTDGTLVKQVNPQEEEPGWTTLKSDRLKKHLDEAKKHNQRLSLLVHNSSEASISALLKDPDRHAQNLVEDVIPLMQQYGFDDLNLDIESFVEASASSQQQYTNFINQVKQGLDTHNAGTLTVEVTPISLVRPHLTDVPRIGHIADYIILMAYDFHYSGSYLAGPVAPLAGAGSVREYDVEEALKQTLAVVPPQKVILGIPLYGYEWETIRSVPGAATIPGGAATASNRRITTDILPSCTDCTKGYDEISKQPYVIFPDGKYFHQIYYEDERSMKEKLQLAQKYNLNGVALWALGYDGDTILEPLQAYSDSAYFHPPLPVIN